MIQIANKYEDLLIDQTCQNQPDTTKLPNLNEARKILGAYTAPDGSRKWEQRVSNGYLSRFDVQNIFKLGLIPALQYPLVVRVLTEKQCDTLLVPAMPMLLNIMGVVKMVNRSIVHSPFQYG